MHEELRTVGGAEVPEPGSGEGIRAWAGQVGRGRGRHPSAHAHRSWPSAVRSGTF